MPMFWKPETENSYLHSSSSAEGNAPLLSVLSMYCVT